MPGRAARRSERGGIGGVPRGLRVARGSSGRAQARDRGLAVSSEGARCLGAQAAAQLEPVAIPPGPHVVQPPSNGHGFTFASAIGQVTADLALEGGTDVDLDMFRLDRFGDPGAAKRGARKEESP